AAVRYAGSGRRDVAAVAVAAVHGLRADGVPPGQVEPRADVGAVAADGAGAPGVVHHRMPRAVIARRIRGRRAGVPGGNLALVRGRRLQLFRYVGVLLHAVCAGGRAAGETERRPVAGRIEVVVGEAVVGMALEADLVLARHIGRGDADVRARSGIAALHDVARGQALERGRAVDGLDAEPAAQHARRDVGVDIARGVVVPVRARRVRRAGDDASVAHEAAELHHAMRVVAVGAFGVAVREIADAELDARLEEILAAHVGRAGAVDETGIAEGAADV